MTAGSASSLTRIIVTAPLLLALSPVTAPFLTFDLRDLLGDSTSPGVALVQPKTAHDEPVSTVATAPGYQVLRAVIAPAPTQTMSRAAHRSAFVPPLRL